LGRRGLIVRMSRVWTGLAVSACACLFGLQPSNAQQTTSSSVTPVVVPAANLSSGIYAWSGAAVNNSFVGAFVGGIYALNGNLGSEGYIFRLEAAGGEYGYTSGTLPNTAIETYNGAAMLGYRKAVGAGWLTGYVGGSFETHNNPDIPSPNHLEGLKGGAKALVEYWGPLSPTQEVYASVSYATPFSTTSAYGRFINKLNDRISIGPEVGYYSNDVYRDVRAGGFISFKTSFGEIAFSGGWRDPLTPGATGYYANVYLGFERLPPGPAATQQSRLPYKASPVSPAFNWSGFYAGGQAGFGWDSVNWSNVDLTAEPVRSKAFGFVGGGQVGYNWQVSQWVVGVEADLLGSDLKNMQPSAVAPGLISYTNKVDMIGTVVGRLGYAMNRSLVYVDGGWATARLTASGVNTVLPDAFATRFHDDGWTIGAGWDYALDNNWILGVDYKRIELKKTTRSGVTDAAIPFTITDIDPKINVLTLRLSYKFGDWGKSPVVAKY